MNNNRHLIHFMGHQVEEMRVLILMARAHGNVKDLLMTNRFIRKQQQQGGGGNNSNNVVDPTASSTSTDVNGSDEVVLLSVACKLDIALQVRGIFHSTHFLTHLESLFVFSSISLLPI